MSNKKYKGRFFDNFMIIFDPREYVLAVKKNRLSRNFGEENFDSIANLQYWENIQAEIKLLMLDTYTRGLYAKFRHVFPREYEYY